MELVFVAVLLEVVEQPDLLAIRLEVGPYVPVDGHDHLALQVLGHAQHVDGGHLVLHADGVLAEGAEGHVDVVVLAVLGEVDGEVAVAGVVDVAAGGLDQVVDGLLVHVGGALAGQLLPVGAGGVGGDDAGAVKAVQADDLDVLDLDGVAGLDDLAALLRHTPLDPGLHALQRADEGHGDLLAVLVGGGHAAVDHVGRPFGGHVVLVVVGGQHRVHLLEGEGVDHEGHVAQVRLHGAAAAHVGHLVAHLHLAVAVGALAVAAPQVDGDVRAARSLEPDAGAAQPPHGDVAGLDDLVLDVLNQPGAPLGERGHDPLLAGHFRYLAHLIPPFLPFKCSFPTFALPLYAKTNAISRDALQFRPYICSYFGCFFITPRTK